MRGCLGKEEPTISEENKAIIRRLYEEVWNQHQHGLDGYKHLVRWLHTAIPDLHHNIEEIIAEGDKVATFVTLSGTHTGPLRDLAPSGRRVSVKHTHWYRLANGKVVETW